MVKHIAQYYLFNLGQDARGQNANATLSAVRLKLRPFFVEHIPVMVSTSSEYLWRINIPLLPSKERYQIISDLII